MEAHTTDKIFISYSRQDEAFARKLAVWLAKTLNVGVWIDVDDIPPGVKWSAAIQDGLDNCEVMVVVVTVESMNSVNVEDEWQYFLDQGKPVVPLLLESAPIPYQLRRIQYIDFSVLEDRNNSQRELIVELRQHLKPLDTEAERNRDTLVMRSSSSSGVVASKHEKNRRTRAKKTVDILERQERALKRNNNLIIFLVFLLIVVGGGFGAFAYWVYINQPTYFKINNAGDAVAYLPVPEGQPTQVVPLSQLDGRAPQGTRIETANEPVELVSEQGSIAAVIQANSSTTVNDLSTEGVNLNVEEGNISVDSQGTQGHISAFGVDFAMNDRFMLQIDNATGDVSADCYDGCTISDQTDGRSRQLSTGDSITFSGTEADFDTAEVVPIPGAIAFVTLRHGAAEVYLMQTDGAGPVQLTNNSLIQDTSPSWSPDGRMIAFVTNMDRSLDIAVMPPNGKQSDIKLLTSDSLDNERDPAWSPDGAHIAFVSNRGGGVNNIFVMDPDGSNVVQLTNREGANTSPTWSPDSRYIAFASTRTGDSEIFVLDTTGADETYNLTNNPAQDTDPAWSPDGTRIAFASTRDNSSPDIYVYNLQDKSIINVTSNTVIDKEPAWSPDNKYLLFTTQLFGNNEIAKINADGTGEITDLSNLPETADEEANWLPRIQAGQ